MLGNRSKEMTSKQSLMADHQNSPPSSTKNYNRPVSSFFGSPRFRAFSTKFPFFETDGRISPTSILENYKPLSAFGNPFVYIEKSPTSPNLFSGNKRIWEKSEPKGIAVALTDLLSDETRSSENFVKSHEKKLLFSNKLTVQIPKLGLSNTLSLSEWAPQSPSDFGMKTRNSNISANGSANFEIISQTKDSPNRIYTGWVSVSDVENSEDYTCVISRGPSPRTTHIFDNCIVEESYCSLSEKFKSSSTDNLLSFCYTCPKQVRTN